MTDDGAGPLMRYLASLVSAQCGLDGPWLDSPDPTAEPPVPLSAEAALSHAEKSARSKHCLFSGSLQE